MQALKAAHEKHANELSNLKGANAHHETLKERVDYVEKLLGDSADKHAGELQAPRDAHGKHLKELSPSRRRTAITRPCRSASANYLEELIGDSAGKHCGNPAKNKYVHPDSDP